MHRKPPQQIAVDEIERALSKQQAQVLDALDVFRETLPHERRKTFDKTMAAVRGYLNQTMAHLREKSSPQEPAI